MVWPTLGSRKANEQNSGMICDSRGGFSGSCYQASDEVIANYRVLRDVAMTTMATVFWLSIYEVHIGATWRCGLTSNYFDHSPLVYYFRES